MHLEYDHLLKKKIICEENIVNDNIGCSVGVNWLMQFDMI